MTGYPGDPTDPDEMVFVVDHAGVRDVLRVAVGEQHVVVRQLNGHGLQVQDTCTREKPAVAVCPGDPSLLVDVSVLAGGGDDDVRMSVGQNEGTLVMKGGRGNDTLSVSGAVGVLLVGGYGNDVLRGGAGRDLLGGGPGRDSLYGGRGRDELDGDGWEEDVIAHGPEAQMSSSDLLDGGPGLDVAWLRR